MPPTSATCAAPCAPRVRAPDPALPSCAICGAPTARAFARGVFTYWRCAACGHVVALPYPSDDALAAHYARGFAEQNYATMQREAADYERTMRGLADALERAFQARGRSLAGAAVLDVGCFDGTFLRELARRGARGSGVEVQPGAAAIARAALGTDAIVLGDILDPHLVLPRASFDAVVLLGVIEHVRDPLALLRRCAVLLAPGGIMLIQTPDAGSLVARVLGSAWPPYTPVEHIHCFSRRSIARALADAGFAVRRTIRHVKALSPAYVHGMLRTFGPRLHVATAPIMRLLPRAIRNAPLPWYVGEVIVVAERQS